MLFPITGPTIVSFSIFRRFLFSEQSMRESTSRSRSCSEEGNRHSGETRSPVHSHSDLSSGGYHHSYRHSPRDSHLREVYHGHRHYRYRAKDRHHRSRSSRSESECDDSKGNYIGEPGDVLDGRYRIVAELGTGTFARAFEVCDLTSGYHFALKIVRAVHSYCDSARIEARVAEDITQRDPEHSSCCYHIYDHFEFGGHFCMVTDLLGPSLYQVLQDNNYHPFPMSFIRPILSDILKGLRFIHGFGLTHTDLKLENVLFAARGAEQKWTNHRDQSIYLPSCRDVTLIDYGSATYATERRHGVINTRQYRAPEVLMNMEWDEESDIWGVGCIGLELFVGDVLFQTHDDLLHLALIERIIGPIPFRLIEAASHSRRRYFNDRGFVRIDMLHHSEREHVRDSRPLREVIGNAFPQFYDLMSRCLVIDPRKRISAVDALKHPFFLGRD